MEDIPYFETFDSYSLTTTISPLPNCWTVPTSIAQSTSSKEDIRYPYLTSALFHSSTASLYFDRPGMEAWFALPQFSTPLNQLQVSFWASVKSEESVPGVFTSTYVPSAPKRRVGSNTKGISKNILSASMVPSGRSVPPGIHF